MAVIGDLIASRAITGRASFQREMNRTFADVNQRSRPASPFTISAGDEVEAVYAHGDTLFRDIFFVLAALHPHRMRFSIALGTITTDLNPENPLLIDGPAFQIARRGINQLKASNELICIAAEPPLDVTLENNAARLLAHHIAPWKKTRWDVLRLIAQGTARANIGDRLGISATAAYKNIRAGALDLVQNLADDLGRSLTAKARP